MFKHSGGIILTHPVPEQIGTDLPAGGRDRFPGLDFADLERLTANQKTAKKGIAIYHSYWRAENPPPRMKKNSAYTPAFIGDDFLIVSAVMDKLSKAMENQSTFTGF